MRKIRYCLSIGLILAIAVSVSCKKEETPIVNNPTVTPPAPKLIFKFKFDSTQVRLNNFGQPESMPAGHAGQSPVFRKMSAHYIELARTAIDSLGKGVVLYHAPETMLGGEKAIDFDSSQIVAEGETFFSIPLSSIAAGQYQYLRVSLAYQNYDVSVKYTSFSFTGTIASFIGYNTYIRNFKPKDSTITINQNRKQGFWAFETPWQVFQGQAPPNATTVPNPIFATSPIPAGSCVVTGPFTSVLNITGNETQDIIITVSLSTNKSFEWIDQHSPDGLYEPLAGDTVINMGIRGLIPIVQ